MGGIGSFVGAPLTRHFKDDADTEIIFICRGTTKEVIQQNGLTFTSGDNTYTSFPDLTSDQPDDIGILDILIIATKSYDLKNALRQFEECINEQTILLPLQNVVNAKELIQESLDKKAIVLEGCIYVASNIEKAGHVKHLGGPGKIFFGNKEGQNFQWVEDLCKKAGIDANYSRDIKLILWKKYLFVSPLAAITAACDITFGELRDDKKLMQRFERMMNEVKNVAALFNVKLSQKHIQDSLNMIKNFPYRAKSSLQLDVENQAQQTEKSYLVDYIIHNGSQNDVDVSVYQTMNTKLQQRM